MRLFQGSIHLDKRVYRPFFLLHDLPFTFALPFGQRFSIPFGRWPLVQGVLGNFNRTGRKNPAHRQSFKYVEAGLIFVAASITASPIANTTDILPFILHIPNYSCINNQKSPLPWYRIEIKTLPWHWQNPPASRKICGLNGAFCKLDIQHKSITTGEQIDTQKLLILQWK